MKTILAAIVFCMSSWAFADTTTGGVNWLDPLTYQKPAFVPITVPNCGGATPNYFVDIGSGSGTTCSSGSPCALTGLGGKPGMSGGPACVWLRGTGGNIQIFSPSLNYFGSAGNEILFQRWPGQTAPVFQNSGNQTLDGTGGKIHHWIFDGGPNMEITIKTTNSNSNIGVRANAPNITFYRTQFTCNNNQGGELIMTTAAGVDNLSIINSEFYDCDSGTGGLQQSAVYMAGDVCNGVSGYSNFLFQNNIVRNMGGEGLELNPRVDSPGATVTGSAFHDIGYNTCNSSWNCRDVITVDSCGGTPSAVVISNNLMWDISASCVWAKAGDVKIYNNTCYDFGKRLGSGTGGTIAQIEGISVGSSGNAGNVTIKNNIIYAPLGTDPFDASFAGADHNLCGSGKSCGTSTRVYSASTFVSTTENASTYLTIGSSSEAKDNGTSLPSIATDYFGTSRPQAGTYDIGAMEFSSGVVCAAPCVRLPIRLQ